MTWPLADIVAEMLDDMTIVTKTCDETEPEQLVAASRASIPLPPDSSRTEDMRVLAERFFQRAGSEKKEQVLLLIDDLGNQLAKG